MYVLQNDYHNRLFDTSIISHSCNACVSRVCGRLAFEISTLSNFQTHNAVLFTIVIVLYITYPEPLHLMTGSL